MQLQLHTHSLSAFNSDCAQHLRNFNDRNLPRSKQALQRSENLYARVVRKAERLKIEKIDIRESTTIFLLTCHNHIIQQLNLKKPITFRENVLDITTPCKNFSERALDTIEERKKPKKLINLYRATVLFLANVHDFYRAIGEEGTEADQINVHMRQNLAFLNTLFSQEIGFNKGPLKARFDECKHLTNDQSPKLGTHIATSNGAAKLMEDRLPVERPAPPPAVLPIVEQVPERHEDDESVSRIRELEDQLALVNANIELKDKEIAQTKNANTALKTENLNVKEQLRNAHVELERSRGIIVELQHQIEDLRNLVSEWERKFRILHGEYQEQRLRSREELRMIEERNNKHLEEERIENEMLRKQLEDHERFIREIASKSNLDRNQQEHPN